MHGRSRCMAGARAARALMVVPSWGGERLSGLVTHRIWGDSEVCPVRRSELEFRNSVTWGARIRNLGINELYWSYCWLAWGNTAACMYSSTMLLLNYWLALCYWSKIWWSMAWDSCLVQTHSTHIYLYVCPYMHSTMEHPGARPAA